MPPPACPDRDQLTSHLLGKLDQSQADAVTEHLRQCARCQAVEAELEAVRDDLVDDLRRPVPEAKYLGEAEIKVLRPMLGLLGQAASSIIFSTVGNTPPAVPRAPSQRSTIGRYEIESELGRGGMGVVYKAHDPKLKRAVAIKLPFFDASRPDHASVKERFLREMEAAAKVEHANVCPVYDAGEVEGAPYAVMKFLDGDSLAARIRRGLMPIRQAVEMAKKIAHGLREIHRVGIVHRDLKPGNVLLSSEGEPAVSDFGLARQDTDANRLTPDGAGVGTPAYVAPEQAEGHEKGLPTMDVYSLGVILYEMLTGQVPFRGSILEVLRRANEEDRPRPSLLRSEIDADLEAIVLRAMARRPDLRFQTAKELIAALDGWLTAEGTQNYPGPQPQPERLAPVISPSPTSSETLPGTPAKEQRGRSPILFLAVAAGIALVFVAVVATWGIYRLTRHPGEIALEKEDDRVAELTGGNGAAEKNDNTTPNTQKDRQKPPAPKDRPLPPAALVMRPAKIDGVRNWTIVPRRAVEVGNHHSLAWSPEGRKLVAAAWSDDSFCTVRNGATGAVEARIEKVKFAFGSQPCCQDQFKAMLALVKTTDKTFALYEAEGVFSRTLKGHKGTARCFAVSRFGEYVASGDDANTFQVWIALADQGLRGKNSPLLSYDRSVRAISWGFANNDYNSLVMQFDDGEIRVYHYFFRKEGARYRAGRLIAWSSVGSQLATQQKDEIILLHPLTGEEQMKLQGHKGNVTSVSWAIEKGRLASVDDLGSLRHWNLQNGKEVKAHSLPHAAAPWLFSPDGRRLACCANNAVYVASGIDGSPIGVSMLLDDEKKYVTITADGHYAGSPGIDDDLLYVVETEEGKLTLTPAEFAKKYGWRNDPKKVNLFGR